MALQTLDTELHEEASNGATSELWVAQQAHYWDMFQAVELLRLTDPMARRPFATERGDMFSTDGLAGMTPPEVSCIYCCWPLCKASWLQPSNTCT